MLHFFSPLFSWKSFFFIFYLFSSFFLFSYQEIPPLRQEKFGRLEFGVSKYLFSPSYLLFNTTLTGDLNRGIYKKIYLTQTLEAELSELFHPELKIVFCLDDRIIDRVSFKNYFKICKYLHFTASYLFRNYTNYRIIENNILSLATFRLPVYPYFLFSLSGGENIRIVDFDILQFGTKYGNDYTWQFLPVFKIAFHFFVGKFYHLGIEFSNMYDEEAVSLGGFQIGWLNRFFPRNDFQIKLDAGIGFAGSGASAGFPNRFWIAFGGSYVYLFRK